MAFEKTVLLVEDDLDDQVFFTEALSEIENAVVIGISNTGQEALDFLQHAAFLPDIIFMDINMPVMNGIQCLERILSIPKFRHIPVVMFSTSCNEIEKLHTSGARAFIQKPNDVKVWKGSIQEMIDLDFEKDRMKAEKTFNLSPG